MRSALPASSLQEEELNKLMMEMNDAIRDKDQKAANRVFEGSKACSERRFIHPARLPGVQHDGVFSVRSWASGKHIVQL